MRTVKLVLLYIAKYTGLFFIARKMTDKGLRILCYHGFALRDENLFRPKLFMCKEKFAKRLDKISELGFSVIGLDEAVCSLRAGKPLSNSIVITVDDGWLGVRDIAWPLFEKHDFPWTLYLSSYYADKQTQVMNLALQYLCWKTKKQKVDLSAYNIASGKKYELRQKSDYEDLAQELAQVGNALDTAEDRQNFVRNIAVVLDVNQSEIELQKLFYFVDMDTVREMHHGGVDIQLHTHRHTLGGVDKEKTTEEINDNREMIEKVCSHKPVHFCYPSGFYTEEHLQWLREVDVVSATTCKTGLNYVDTPLLELNRFLDGEDISHIEFEAELSGFKALLRGLK